MELGTSYTKIATGSSKTIGPTSGYLILYGKVVSRDLTNLQTKVTLQLRVKASAGSFTSSGNTASIKCGATTKNKSFDIGTVTTSEKSIQTETFTIQHDGEGNAVGITCSGSSNVYGSVTLSVKGSFDLQPIQVNPPTITSSVTPTSGIVQGNTPVTITCEGSSSYEGQTLKWIGYQLSSNGTDYTEEVKVECVPTLITDNVYRVTTTITITDASVTYIRVFGYDSLGLKDDGTDFQLSVIPYNLPTANSFRIEWNDASTALNISYSYSAYQITGNTLSVKVQYYDAEWKDWYLFSNPAWGSVDDSMDNVTGIVALDESVQYQMRLIVSDAYGNSTYENVLETSYTLINYREMGISFGGISNAGIKDGDGLYVHMDANFYGNVSGIALGNMVKVVEVTKTISLSSGSEGFTQTFTLDDGWTAIGIVGWNNSSGSGGSYPIPIRNYVTQSGNTGTVHITIRTTSAISSISYKWYILEIYTGL